MIILLLLGSILAAAACLIVAMEWRDSDGQGEVDKSFEDYVTDNASTCMAQASAAVFAIALFNWPGFMVKPSLRAERGWLGRRLRGG